MLEFVFWDVQHGSATYIKTPNGKNIVIDLGTGSYGDSNFEFSPLLYLKNYYEIERLDGVIITHPHSDHLDDIFHFYELSPRALFRPNHLSESDIRNGNREQDAEVINKYLEINTNYSSEISTEENPFNAQNNGGVEFQFFSPVSCSTNNLNNHSIVSVISHAHCKIIISGDNEPPSWNELLERDDFKSAIERTHIIVAPHHGRESGFSPELFEHINTPKLTIISDGRFCDTSATNRYSDKMEGWTVYKRSGGEEIRKCISTRNDGVILVKFWENSEGQPYLNVIIN